MNSRVAITVLLAFLFINITACTSKLAYKKNFGDPASPEDNNFVFSLRDSTILILPPETKNKASEEKKSDDQSVDISPRDGCQFPNKDKKNIKKLTAEDVFNRCFSGVSVKAAAARDTNTFYVASPGSGTTITPTAVDSDPFMVKSISVNYKNPAVGIVNSAGAGAVAGFAIGGPWGATIGGGLGVVGGLLNVVTIKSEPILEIYEPVSWIKNVCKEDQEAVNTKFASLKKSADDDPHLFLPIALDYKTDVSLSKCWHLLPNRSLEATDSAMLSFKGPTPLSGWFYRLVPSADPDKEAIPGKKDLPPVLKTKKDPNQDIISPFQKREEYFSTDDVKNSFPISACRSVEVQITWWKEMPNADGKTNTFHYFKAPVTVADSDYVQKVILPKNGTVNLLPVCGGYASPTQTSSSISELVDAVVKQAQAIKEAQSKYDSK